MKIIYLLISITLLYSCTIFSHSKSGKLSITKLKKEPWYFCNTDSLWTYNEYNKAVPCSDYSQVTRLRVTNILGEIYFKGSYDLFCEETDSIILGKTLLVTASDLKNMIVPIDSFPNLQILDISHHHFFKFPYEIFSIPNLIGLNIDNLCLHDYCEPCLYVDESYLLFDKEGKKRPYVDSSDYDNYYRTNLKPYYNKMQQIKFIRNDRYHHPDDWALIDSINRANEMDKHWELFECIQKPCRFDHYDDWDEESRLKVEIIWQ